MHDELPAQPGASATAIQHHYDVGDEFYRLWLDPSMSYSAALFAPGDSLESAQNRKLDYHIEQLRVNERSRVLDVGCGWGAMLRRLVLNAKVEAAVGLTLSEAQHRLIRAQGIPGISAHLEGWKAHQPDASYDAIVSIGAFEHFARPELSASEKVAAYREFFRFCHSALVPYGRLSLQTICFGTLRAGRIDPFISQRVFPESDLPYPWEVLEAADGYFEVRALRNDRTHYAQTCREWYRNLKANHDRAVALVGEEKVAEYERYLKISVASFATHALGLLRVSFDRLKA